MPIICRCIVSSKILPAPAWRLRRVRHWPIGWVVVVELSPLVEQLREALKQHTVLHADETPVAMLAPGKKRTHTAYVWAYASTRYANIQGVVYDFRPSRAGKEAEETSSKAGKVNWC